MARKNKSLANAFSRFEESEKKNGTQNHPPQSEAKPSEVTPLHTKERDQEIETVNRNSEAVTKDVTQGGNTNTKSSSSTRNKQQKTSERMISDERQPESPSKTVRDVSNTIMSMYDEKTKKKTVEETHNRATFLFRKDLQERLDNMADGKRGFKTMFMNKAIEALLDEMEDMNR